MKRGRVEVVLHCGECDAVSAPTVSDLSQDGYYYDADVVEGWDVNGAGALCPTHNQAERDARELELAGRRRELRRAEYLKLKAEFEG